MNCFPPIIEHRFFITIGIIFKYKFTFTFCWPTLLRVTSFNDLLILFNYFIELSSVLLNIFFLLLLFLNLLWQKKPSFNFSKVFTYENIFLYIIIPGILLISSADINFHYDAAYYHLNHQNWLRSSNLIIGTVNIFWPFGMSSIYEYISSMLWFNDSLIYLHLLNLIFLHFFFSFIF